MMGQRNLEDQVAVVRKGDVIAWVKELDSANDLIAKGRIEVGRSLLVDVQNELIRLLATKFKGGD